MRMLKKRYRRRMLKKRYCRRMLRKRYCRRMLKKQYCIRMLKKQYCIRNDKLPSSPASGTVSPSQLESVRAAEWFRNDHTRSADDNRLFPVCVHFGLVGMRNLCQRCLNRRLIWLPVSSCSFHALIRWWWLMIYSLTVHPIQVKRWSDGSILISVERWGKMTSAVASFADGQIFRMLLGVESWICQPLLLHWFETWHAQWCWWSLGIRTCLLKALSDLSHTPSTVAWIDCSLQCTVQIFCLVC